MKNDYPELEKTTIKFEHDDGKVVTAFVVGINFDIGITIVDNNNREINLICLNGKSSKNYHLDDTVYKSLFCYVVAKVRRGYYRAGLMVKFTGKNGSLAPCPYNP